MKEKCKLVAFRAVGILFIVAFFSISWKILRYILTDDTDSYSRLMMHEFYEQESIDTLILGPSHVMYGLDSGVTGKMFEGNTFHAASASQPVDVTHLLLEEAISRYDIKHVYIETSCRRAVKTLDKKQREMQPLYRITDYMLPSLRRNFFLLKHTDAQAYVNTFLAARRDWEKIFDKGYLESVFRKKRDVSYKEYEPVDNGTERYVAKGFVEKDDRLKVEDCVNYFEKVDFSIDQIEPQWVEELNDMIHYCKENDVEVTLIAMPFSLFGLKSYREYDAYIAYLQENILNPNPGVEYYDFNLVRPEYWSNANDYFFDFLHLNKQGAEKFTGLFCRFSNGEIQPEKFFYNSLQEKFEALPPAFYGILLEEQRGQLAVNHQEELTTQVTLVSEKGETVVKKWGTDIDFEIPEDFSGKCKVDVLCSSQPDKVQYYTLELEE